MLYAIKVTLAMLMEHNQSPPLRSGGYNFQTLIKLSHVLGPGMVKEFEKKSLLYCSLYRVKYVPDTLCALSSSFSPRILTDCFRV